MMRLALAQFGKEIAPRFGCCGQFLIVEIVDGQIKQRQPWPVGRRRPFELPALLAELKIDKLICGGIHHRFQSTLEQLGIEVIWGVIGPVDQTLTAFLASTLKRDQFVCPGRSGPKHHRRGGPKRRRRGGSNRPPDPKK